MCRMRLRSSPSAGTACRARLALRCGPGTSSSICSLTLLEAAAISKANPPFAAKALAQPPHSRRRSVLLSFAPLRLRAGVIARPIQHGPEKWKPVFRKDHAPLDPLLEWDIHAEDRRGFALHHPGQESGPRGKILWRNTRV